MIGMTNGNAGGSIRMPPRNWLDNSDFTNLVAQAGIGGNHGDQAYAADRWILESGTVEYTEGLGLMLNGTIVQRLERAPTVASCFVGMASGTATITMDGTTITITSAGGTIQWAALYEGNISSGRMPVYQPKGYVAEYLECCRYFCKIIPAGNGFLSNSGQERILILRLPTAMRTVPNLALSKGFILVVRGNSGYDSKFPNVGAKPKAISAYMRVNPTEDAAVGITFTNDQSNLVNNNPISIIPGNGTSYVGLIADL